jgi:hypothetical protein
MQPENTPTVDQKAPQEQAQTQQPQAEPQIKSEENKPNWAAFRAAREAERKAKDEAERRANEKAAEASALRAALEAAVSKPNHNQNQEQDDDEDVRIQRKIDTAVEARLQRERQAIAEREQAEFPQKLARDYPDFHQVCSAENLDYLDYHYPELSQPFKYMPEGYEKWAAVYKMAKRFASNPEAKKDAAKADKNMNKPQSMSLPGAVQGQTVMHSNRLTEEKKASNWARMQRTLQGLSE